MAEGHQESTLHTKERTGSFTTNSPPGIVMMKMFFYKAGMPWNTLVVVEKTV